MLSMCEALEVIGFRTTLFAGRNPDQPRIDDDQMFAEYGIETKPALHWVRWEQGNWRWRARTFFTTIWWAKRFDICFARNSISAFACHLRKKTCYYELHEPFVAKMDRVMLRVLRHSSWVRFVAISDMLAQMVSDDIGLDRSRIVTSHDGCKIPCTGTDSFELDSALLSYFKGPGLLAVYVGSFYQGRGVDTIAELAHRHADVQFLAIGGTASGAGLRPDAMELLNLRVIDRIPHRLVGGVLRHADILLMPYAKRVTAEGKGDYLRFFSPLKMFEYLAAGKAIISSGSPSIEEILRDGENAIVVEADNLDAWSNAVQRLKRDPQLRALLGRNAFATALEHRWEVRARALLSESEAKNGHW